MLKDGPYNADIVGATPRSWRTSRACLGWFRSEHAGREEQGKGGDLQDREFRPLTSCSRPDQQLGAAAAPKDRPVLRASFGGVAKACGNCHDSFREKIAYPLRRPKAPRLRAGLCFS